MALDYEESKKKIVEALEKKQKTKSKFYFNDLSKILEAKPREAKKRCPGILVKRQHDHVRLERYRQAGGCRARRLVFVRFCPGRIRYIHKCPTALLISPA